MTSKVTAVVEAVLSVPAVGVAAAVAVTQTATTTAVEAEAEAAAEAEAEAEAARVSVVLACHQGVPVAVVGRRDGTLAS